jgi:hypothetical protein
MVEVQEGLQPDAVLADHRDVGDRRMGGEHVLHLGGPELEGFLRDHPPVMLRMLKTVALRLRNANRWRS